MAEIERLVGATLGMKTVPIVPPGAALACAKRFVGGDLDDRLDGVIVFSLPPDSFKTQRDGNEVKFSGTYQIFALDLSTMAEDRHNFTFTDSEPVTSGVAAILAVPAQLLAERTSGKKLVSSSTWQASESVQARVEAKLVVATRLYLSTAAIRNLRPLNPLETAQHLLDAGEGDAAMAVFRSVGMNNPQVASMIADARQKMARSRATALLGKALGAMAAADNKSAGTLLAAYEKEPAADPARIESLRRALDSRSGAGPSPASEQVLKSNVPALDQAAFVAMVKQVFSEQAGVEPEDVTLQKAGLEVVDKAVEGGLKTRLDGYALALAKSAELMSLRCGCNAEVQLKAETAGATLLRSRFGPSFNRPQVGLP